MFFCNWEFFTFTLLRALFFDYSISNFHPQNLLTNVLERVTIRQPWVGGSRLKMTTWSDHNCPIKSYPLPWCLTTSTGSGFLRPHIWPLSEPDFLETVARSGLYSNLFGRKSTYWTLYHAKNYTLSLGVKVDYIAHNGFYSTQWT